MWRLGCQKRFDNDTDLMAEDLQKFTTPTTEVGPSVDTRAVNFRHSSNITQKKLRRAMPLVGDRAAVLKGFVTAIDNADIVRRNDESVIADSAHSTAKATVVSKKKSPSSVDTNMTDGDRSLADFCDEPDKEVRCGHGKLTAKALLTTLTLTRTYTYTYLTHLQPIAKHGKAAE